MCRLLEMTICTRDVHVASAGSPETSRFQSSSLVNTWHAPMVPGEPVVVAVPPVPVVCPPVPDFEPPAAFVLPPDAAIPPVPAPPLAGSPPEPVAPPVPLAAELSLEHAARPSTAVIRKPCPSRSIVEASGVRVECATKCPRIRDRPRGLPANDSPAWPPHRQWHTL